MNPEILQNSNLPEYINIEGSSSLLRDTKSHGVVNADSQGLSQAKARKASALSLQNQIKTLEDEVRELKNLVKMIADKTSK